MIFDFTYQIFYCNKDLSFGTMSDFLLFTMHNIINCSIPFESLLFDADHNKDRIFTCDKEIIFYEKFEKILPVKG
jgi:hypothetical protein